MKLIIFLFINIFICLYSAEVVIKPGSNAKAVSQSLKDAGIIESKRLFYIYLRANKLDSKIHTGTFTLNKGDSFRTISDVITGKKQQLQKVTIPEGYTLNEVAQKLEKNEVISSSKLFLNYLSKQTPQTINHLLKNEKVNSFEGLLFPDTYYFSKNMTHQQVYNSFIKRFNNVFLTHYQSALSPPLSFYDTLILASIIEKEAGTQKEMATISGVFHNRLKKKMYLASCPTVGYAMGKPRKKSLTYKDLDYVSPFNTYRNKGLPPTPIAAPGKKAFLAALNPKKTPYLYFVAKNDGSGEHVFSLTLKDHLQNQKKILARTQ